MRGYFPDSVSDYTKEQCEEYLSAHPNGLRADSIRERLKTFTSHASSEKSTIQTDTEERKTKDSHNNSQEGTNSPLMRKVNSNQQVSQGSTEFKNFRSNDSQGSKVGAVLGKIFGFLVGLHMLIQCIMS